MVKDIKKSALLANGVSAWNSLLDLCISSGLSPQHIRFTGGMKAFDVRSGLSQGEV